MYLWSGPQTCATPAGLDPPRLEPVPDPSLLVGATIQLEFGSRWEKRSEKQGQFGHFVDRSRNGNPGSRHRSTKRSQSRGAMAGFSTRREEESGAGLSRESA